MFVWSTTGLPNPSTDFANKAETSVIRTKFDSGRVRQRRRFLSGLRTMQVSWLLNEQEYAIFQAVYLYKLSSGADYFTMSLDLGNGFTDYTVRFIGEGWSAGYKEVSNWRCSGTMEVNNISPLTEDELDDLLA